MADTVLNTTVFDGSKNLSPTTMWFLMEQVAQQRLLMYLV